MNMAFDAIKLQGYYEPIEQAASHNVQHNQFSIRFKCENYIYKMKTLSVYVSLSMRNWQFFSRVRCRVAYLRHVFLIVDLLFVILSVLI